MKAAISRQEAVIEDCLHQLSAALRQGTIELAAEIPDADLSYL